jgi:DNA-binding beta-propeller fold protein YncE
MRAFTHARVPESEGRIEGEVMNQRTTRLANLAIAIAFTAGLVLVVLTASANAKTKTPEGELKPLPGQAACLAETGLGGKCGAGTGLDVLFDVVVSPDGKNVYAFGRETVSAYTRHPDGSLTHVNCVSEDTTFGKCADGFGLEQGENNGIIGGKLFVSPDGRHVYALNTMTNMIVLFKRNADGSLEEASGPKKCVSSDTAGGECTEIPMLNNITDLRLSSDGRHFYAASYYSSAVFILQRDPATGYLSQSAVEAERCVSPTAPNCKPISDVRIKQPVALDVSPDGKHVYIASNGQDPTSRDVLASFSRNPTTGELTAVDGPSGCVSASGSNGECLASPFGNGLGDVVVSPNGKNLYLAGSGRLEVDPLTGRLGNSVVWEAWQGVVRGHAHLENTAFTSDGRFMYAYGSTVAIEESGDLDSLSNEGLYYPYDIPYPGDVAVSPDDRNVYIVGLDTRYGEATLNVFNRAPKPMDLGRLKRRPNGSVVLSVTAPETGTVSLAKTKLVKGAQANARAAGPQKVRVKVAPSAKARRLFEGSVRVNLKLRFETPTGQVTKSAQQVKLALEDR